MIYDATGRIPALSEHETAVWDRVAGLGLKFPDPQVPDGWQPPAPQPDVPPETRNVPTWVQGGHGPGEACRQFVYAIASCGFHERLTVRSLNEETNGIQRPLPAADQG